MAFCPECGAPMDETVEGANTAMYPELARANLLRMRGDYKQAENICLSILKRYPNNASAHTLLGDIYAEQGELEQAAQWYELALDIVPESESDRRKLESVRRRIHERDTAATADQIGLPPKDPQRGILYAFAAGLAIFLLVGTYFLGRTMGIRQERGVAVVQQPIDAGAPRDHVVIHQPAPAPAPVQEERRIEAGDEDRALVARITQQAGAEGGRIVNASIDPRTRMITLTYNVPEGDDERTIGARLAVAALTAEPASNMVTLRAMRNGALVFSADVTREAMRLVQSPEWQQMHQQDPLAFRSALFSNPWPADPTQAGGMQQQPLGLDAQQGQGGTQGFGQQGL
jgi:hypothetical protein